MGLEISAATWLAGAGLAVSAVSAAVSYQQQKKSSKAQKAAEAARQRASSAEMMRERIKQTRDMRLQRAAAMQAGSNFGMGTTSSTPLGAASSAQSQSSSNIGSISVQEGFAEIASQAYQKAASYNTSAAGWQALGNFGSSIFNMAAPTAFKDTGGLWGDRSKNKMEPVA